MSRTFRRKNYEREVRNKAGCSIAGFYTEYDIYYCGQFLNYVYREPTKEEAFKTFQKAHGDGVEHHNTFRKVGRRFVQKQHRQKNNKLIIDYLKKDSEDVVHEVLAKYPKHWWYW